MDLKKSATYVSPKTNREVANGMCSELPIILKSVNSIEELFPMLSNPRFHTEFIVICAEMFVQRTDKLDLFDIINTLSTLIKSTVYWKFKNEKPQPRNTKIIVIVDESTDIALVRQVSNFPNIACVGWVVDSAEDLPQSQQHLAAMLQGNFAHDPRVTALLKPQRKKTVTVPSAEIKLTSRQAQILKLIQDKGCSNKHIAKTLGVTESTVKLHMSAIFKKFGVRNRTQLAMFSKE
jgi:DNA-binding NarL/FixJ family response regulator